MGNFSEALKILSTINNPCQEVQLSKLLLDLNLKNHAGGQTNLSHLISSSVKESKGFLPLLLQYAVDALVYGELDEILLQEMWMYLNIDQQQLLICLCVKYQLSHSIYSSINISSREIDIELVLQID